MHTDGECVIWEMWVILREVVFGPGSFSVVLGGCATRVSPR